MNHKQWDRYAKEYDSYIISPLVGKVKNPIFDDIGSIKNSKDKVVADIGAGRGDLLSLLADKFKKVYAIDFSEKMLDIAKKNNSNYSNIRFKQVDIRKLNKLKLKLDVAISVNSILHPSYLDVDRSLKEIHKSLNKKGTFIGIFPSMEAVIYNFMLTYEREHEGCKDEKQALKSTRRIVERRKYNIIKGIYDDDGEIQKLFYEFELKIRLKKAGFKKICFKKVFYPWGEENGDYESFAGHPEMWDWYIIATK